MKQKQNPISQGTKRVGCYIKVDNRQSNKEKGYLFSITQTDAPFETKFNFYSSPNKLFEY